MTSQRNTLIIDADVICYRFAYRNQSEIDWNGDGNTSVITFTETLEDQITEFIENLLEKTHTEKPIIVLSDKSENNYRLKILPSYKQNRADKEKPKLWYVIRKFLESGYHGYDVRMWSNLEGDDVLGILATRKGNKGKCVLATIDKDLRTIPGYLYLFNKPELGVIPIDPIDAMRYHMTQVLTGDVTDGYKGCPGIGPKKAENLIGHLDDPEEIWQVIIEAYSKKKLTEEDALVQARCAYILQSGDYNQKTGEVRPWTIQTAIRNIQR